MAFLDDLDLTADMFDCHLRLLALGDETVEQGTELHLGSSLGLVVKERGYCPFFRHSRGLNSGGYLAHKQKYRSSPVEKLFPIQAGGVLPHNG